MATLQALYLAIDLPMGRVRWYDDVGDGAIPFRRGCCNRLLL